MIQLENVPLLETLLTTQLRPRDAEKLEVRGLEGALKIFPPPVADAAVIGVVIAIAGS